MSALPTLNEKLLKTPTTYIPCTFQRLKFFNRGPPPPFSPFKETTVLVNYCCIFSNAQANCVLHKKRGEGESPYLLCHKHVAGDSQMFAQQAAPVTWAVVTHFQFWITRFLQSNIILSIGWTKSHFQTLTVIQQ